MFNDGFHQTRCVSRSLTDEFDYRNCAGVKFDADDEEVMVMTLAFHGRLFRNYAERPRAVR